MSFLASFIGGMAGAYNDDRDAEKLDARKRAIAEYENELQAKREETALKLREKFQIATEQRQRTQNISDAQDVQAAGDAKQVERARGIINSDTGIEHTPEEVKKIIADPTWTENYGARHDAPATGPTQWDGQGGLINARTAPIVPSTDRSAYQEQMDLGNAAANIGRPDLQAKHIQAADSARRYAADESREAERKADNLRAEKKQDQMFEWQKTQAGINNRRLDLADSRNARQQDYIELKDSRADDDSKRRSAVSALKDLEEKSKELSRGIATGALNPEALEIDKRELKAVDAERARYRNLLGNMAGMDPAKEEPKQLEITPAAIEKLKKNRGQTADFDRLFGAGAAKNILETAGDQKTKAPVGGTSGNHELKPEASTMNRETIQRQIDEKTMRKNLKGTDPEIVLRLESEIRELKARLRGGSSLNLMSTGR